MTKDGGSSSPDSLVREVVAQWRHGQRPDAAGFLESHPEIRDRKSLAIDLIYEEYCLRHESGETLLASTFCGKFPDYKQSLQRMLDVHNFMQSQPGSEHADRPAGETVDESPIPWPSPGEEFQGYRVIEQLGSGALARVYLAREIALGSRHVVIKVSRHGTAEAHMLGKLEHPSIVPIHSVHHDETTGLTCICMPFLGTATLGDLLDSAFAKGKAPESSAFILRVARHYKPLGIREMEESASGILGRGTYVEGVVQLGLQLAEALTVAHDGGVLHRDIKPSNVLLSRGGRAMLLDFNLSTDVEMPLARVGGTLAYMAPERIRALMGKDYQAESRIDPRSDLYSLGALLYEQLAGDLPSRPAGFNEGKPQRLEDWLKCRLVPPESIRRRNCDVDVEVERVLLRCLTPEPSERFASAAELAAALKGCLTWQPRAVRWLRRNRRISLAAAGGMFIAAVAGGAWWRSLPPEETREYERGLKAYEAGLWQQAKDSFDRSLQAKPGQAPVLFARAQAMRQMGDFTGALQNYTQAAEFDNSGILNVFSAYCHIELQLFEAASASYEAARQHGLDSAEISNNLAYCLGQRSRPQRALQELHKAVAMDQENGTIRYHRAVSQLRLATQTGIAPPPEALDDVEMAVGRLEPSAALHLDAARLYARSTKEPKEAVIAKGAAHLKAAMRLGITEAEIENCRVELKTLMEQLATDADALPELHRTPTPPPRLTLPPSNTPVWGTK